MQGFHPFEDYYELSDFYRSGTRTDVRSAMSGVMVNDVGADTHQVDSSTPPCHGSASSSQEGERLILDRWAGSSRRRQFEDDPDVKLKLRGFYCVTAILVLYTSVYFTYLLLRKR